MHFLKESKVYKVTFCLTGSAISQIIFFIIKSTLFVLCILFLPISISAQGVTHLNTNINDRDLIEDLEKAVPELMERAEIPGLSIAVIRGGETIWYKGFGVQNTRTKKSVSVNTVFEAASLSKPVFAYAIMQIVDEGVLDLDTPLIEYLPEKIVEKKIIRHSLSKEGFRIDWFRKITARIVLSHSSGMTNGKSRQPFPLLFEPGTGFKYSAEGIMYLQLVIEHLTGKQLNDIINEYVFEPLQMNNSSFVWRKKFKNEVAVGHDMIGGTTGKPRKPSRGNAAASLYTTAEDYAKFMLAIMNGTRLKNQTLNEMLTSQINVEKLAYGEPNSTKNVFWGLGFGIERTIIGDAFFHWGDNGTFRNYAIGFKNQKIGVVYLANSFHGLSIGRDLTQYAIGITEPGLYWLSYMQYDSAPLMLIHTVLKKGINEVVKLYPEIKERHPDGFNEFMLNAYIYELLRLNKVKEAIVIFEHTVQSFPESSVLYNSLGEAYMKNGDKTLAVKSYEKSLQLNPNNKNAKQMLVNLRK
jgi:CubicO group peptidase (beta-lactamase class C family)